MFVGIFGGIVELVLDMRQVAARAAHQIGVALGAERHDHGFGHDLFAAHQRQAIGRGVALQFGRAGRAIAVAADDRHHRSGDGRAGANDVLHFSAVLDVHAGGRRLFVPGAQHNLALAGFEIQRRAQNQLRWRCHHMLALLVFVDRIRQMVGLFEQDMTQPQLGSMSRCRKPGRPRSHNRDAVRRHNDLAPPGLTPFDSKPVAAL